MRQAEQQTVFAASLDPGQSVARDQLGVKVRVINETAVEIILEVNVRRQEQVGGASLVKGQAVFAVSLEPGKSIKRRQLGLFLHASNTTADEMVVEVNMRRQWENVVDAAVQDASPESPELQVLSEKARHDLSASLEKTLSHPESNVPTENLLLRAVDIATRASPELGALSPQSYTLLLVNILKHLPKDERDIAIPIFSMQSAEKLGERVVTATWALVGATVALVLATIALIIVTASQ